MRCNRCGKRSDFLYAHRREAGGNYRRAHRSYPSSICQDCVLDIASLTGEKIEGYERRGVLQDARDILGVRTFQSSDHAVISRDRTVHNTVSSPLFRFRREWDGAQSRIEKRAVLDSWISGDADTGNDRYTTALVREHQSRVLAKLSYIFEETP